MLRSRSVSSFGNSSAITGDSLQLALEGQWDENISIEELHREIMGYLMKNLEGLKNKYIQLKVSHPKRQERIMKKVVAARIKYQRYMNVTKDVLHNCNEFMKVRKDTPGSRLAFIRNVQDYLAQAKEFVKMDISLKKISPSLLSYIQPSPYDTPELFAKKREMRKAMSLVLQNDKNCITTNGLGKQFRSRYAQQHCFVHKDFPDGWIPHFPTVLRNSLKGKNSSDKRWLITIMYLFSKHCSVNYIQQGYCSSCFFPIIHNKNQGLGTGKLFCLSCKKEIDWTYYMNPRTICLIMSGFHKMEIEECRQLLIECIREDPELFDSGSMEFFEDNLDSYIENRLNYETESSTKGMFSSSTTVVENEEATEDVQPEVTRTENSQPPDELPQEDEESFPSFNSVAAVVTDTLRGMYGVEATMDIKSAKESYSLYRSEILSFEGKTDDVVPRGLIPKIERYVCHHYKLPNKDDIRKLPLTEKGDRENTSRKMIYDALIELSLGKHSHLVSKISQKLWGSQLPCMKEHYTQIIHDCILQKEVFNRLSSYYGRKSNISQRVILMYISQRYGYRWDVDDFHISFSSVTLKKHIDILKEIFSIIDQKKTS
jgi:hypothetical protein